ncbi:YlxQ family RNA-binding protein [Bacillus suaedaesalsae]|uniref:YlxQ family RNA-binding protein n=1 Tax=Bacillus suaedaesalsae TaxID=2810349 RepID=A0ABS2DLN6_9BACI|nr:YlxQ family RNA-binding protein [Bacillus suaedaesalsae]MBM6618403.1 YlxQ family RNA-binding protein [Bacillus suaedaesalsae]
MNQKPWKSLLGLAARARKIISGEELVVKEIQRKSAKLVLLSKDASKNTEKKIKDKCSYYQVPIRYVENRSELGQAIGKEERVVIGILDDGFAKKLNTLLEE